MKNSFLSFAGALAFLLVSFLSFGNESNIIFSDDFTDQDAWHMQGNGDVNVNNGICNFDNVYCGDYNRVYRTFYPTLPTLYWRAECEFTILNSNPYGNGTGEVVLALTAGSLDFMSYNAAQGYEETTQDGIAVVLMSDGSVDNNINNWFFMIEGKKGNYRTFNLQSVIHADASISKYYIRLERMSESSTMLSIFSDSAYTQLLPGGPVTFDIDPTIDRLCTIQHGTMTPGFTSRLINAQLDNDVIYDDSYFTGLSNPLALAASLRVFPNPAINSISVNASEIPEIKPGSVFSIFNLAGQEITRDILAPEGQIDISELMKGAFILVVRGTEKALVTRFVKTE
ncbi:MAG: T9SS type A sorting domain-containing protein [Bacteroidales bacterium]|nr:T9SS type A sorting domain-containing protein [Bacteroidales bacterium]